MPLNTPDHELQQSLGRKMRQARDAAGMTAASAAKSLRIDRRTLHAWEKGEYAAPAIAVPRMAELYRVSCEWLLAPPGRFSALVDREIEDALVRRGDTSSLVEKLQSMSVLVTEHLESVPSVGQWHDRLQAMWSKAEPVLRRSRGDDEQA